jgi:hypothetical protein
LGYAERRRCLGNVEVEEDAQCYDLTLPTRQALHVGKKVMV